MLQFTKMSGAGNDFLVFDNRGGEIEGDVGELVRRLCTRALSVGGDGVILAGRGGAGADVRMVYYNADGGRAAFCANGARCLARFAVLQGLCKGPLVRMETDVGLVEARVLDAGTVSVPVPGPYAVEVARTLRVDTLVLHGSYAVAGVPHYVLSVENLWAHSIEEFARKIRSHPDLGPEGANVDFVMVKSPQVVQVRTYERGVERETLACGSGCVASALVLSEIGSVVSPVVMQTRSGIDLTVQFRRTGEGWSDVVLTGDARVVFSGFLEPEATVGFPIERRSS